VNAKRKRSLLLLGSQMAVGGAQHVLLSQARWFANNGYQVTAAFFYDRDGLCQRWSREYGLEIIDLKAWRTGESPWSNLVRLCGGLRRLLRLMRREKFDVVETFTQHANVLGLPSAWTMRIPTRVGTYHGKPKLSLALNRLHTMILNSFVATHIVAVSDHTCRKAVTEDRIRKPKIRVIRNGIDFAAFQRPAPEDRAETRRDLEIPGSARLIVNVGRLVLEKDQILLIEAMPPVLSHCPDATLAIAGDGPLRAELRNRARQLEIIEKIRFLGTYSDVPRLLASADLFAYPSQSDGLPLALLEALASRVPVIASRFDSADGLLQHNNNALLFEVGDLDGLSKALIFALDRPEEMQLMAQAAFSQIRHSYSVDEMCRGYDELFRSSLTSGCSSAGSYLA